MINKLLLASDIYFIRPKLFIFHKENFSTLLGGLFSIITILSISSLSMYFVYQVLARTSTRVVFSQSSKYFNSFDHSSIPIMVGMFDALGSALKNPDSTYYVEGRYSSFINDPKTEKVIANFTKIVFEKCDINKHFGDYADIFRKVPFFNDWYCFQPGKYNMSLFGKYGDLGGFSMLDIYFYKCKNATTGAISNSTASNSVVTKNTNGGPACLEKSNIDTIINTGVGSLMYIDYDIDHDNVEDPQTMILKNDLMTLSPYLFKRMMINKKNVKYRTDYGLFIESNRRLDFYQYDFSQTTYNLNDINNLMYAQITLQTSGKTDLYSREYYKIQNCLADIGGIMKGIMTVFTVLLSLINDQFFFLSIINNLFLIDNESKKLNIKKFEYLKNMKMNSAIGNNNNNFDYNINIETSKPKKFSSPTNLKLNNYLKDIMNNNEESKIMETRKKVKKLTLNWKELICPTFLLSKKSNVEKLEEHKKIVFKYLSIENMISNFNDINKLKLLYLNERELEIFNQIDYLMQKIDDKAGNSTLKHLELTGRIKQNNNSNSENY